MKQFHPIHITQTNPRSMHMHNIWKRLTRLAKFHIHVLCAAGSVRIHLYIVEAHWLSSISHKCIIYQSTARSNFHDFMPFIQSICFVSFLYDTYSCTCRMWASFLRTIEYWISSAISFIVWLYSIEDYSTSRSIPSSPHTHPHILDGLQFILWRI